MIFQKLVDSVTAQRKAERRAGLYRIGPGGDDFIRGRGPARKISHRAVAAFDGQDPLHPG